MLIGRLSRKKGPSTKAFQGEGHRCNQKHTKPGLQQKIVRFQVNFEFAKWPFEDLAIGNISSLIKKKKKQLFFTIAQLNRKVEPLVVQFGR